MIKKVDLKKERYLMFIDTETTMTRDTKQWVLMIFQKTLKKLFQDIQ